MQSARSVADTLSRAVAAFAALEKESKATRAVHEAIREFGRIAGWSTTLTGTSWLALNTGLDTR